MLRKIQRRSRRRLSRSHPGRLKQKRPGMFDHAQPISFKSVNLFQPKRYEQRFVNLPIYLQSIVRLIMGNCEARAPSDVAIDRAGIVSLMGQTRLNTGPNRAACVIITRPGVDINNQPAAVVPPVVMVSPPMFGLLVPITVTARRRPAAVVVIRLIALHCERRGLLLARLAPA